MDVNERLNNAVVKKYGRWVGEPPYVVTADGSSEKHQQCTSCFEYAKVGKFCSNCGADMTKANPDSWNMAAYIEAHPEEFEGLERKIKSCQDILTLNI